MYLKKKKKSQFYFGKNGLFYGVPNLAMIYLVKADRELGVSNKMILIALKLKEQFESNFLFLHS